MASSSKNDIHVQFSRLTQTNVDQFCSDHGIDPSLEVVAHRDRTANDHKYSLLQLVSGREPSLSHLRIPFLEVVALGDRTANKCPEGHVVFYTCILEQPNLRYHFINFFLEVLKYYRLSLGQLAPVGVARGLNEKEPEAAELEQELLKLRASRSMLRAYPEKLLVLLGISENWNDLEFEPSFVVDRKDMSALDFNMVEDSSAVELESKEVLAGRPLSPVIWCMFVLRVILLMFLFNFLWTLMWGRRLPTLLGGLPGELLLLVPHLNLPTLSPLIVGMRMRMMWML
ncbi:hypothetical protein HanRHA438_Chr05g0234051 [Helianthus annuus]|uniref:Uncharacterized protein n=1 Tax=Helianthus annuus TaxID=4232 RepID=A0A9K3J1R2_HELAN|nr:hypothetical protein HanXRQr2_Chr05g0225041 [Helianthus annuus]KAJ0585310.1 hypothetical protein HanHA89_Chr05g0198901 [Helianthus annuus]KAJ0919821.1 hypothetical protein HanRHA438_Chr05g0234051 [Helianthus annuus]KAJ0923541.1 hypothetical protein HanPSC8_Chr05g0217161 [Helianthus annuus]